VIDIQLRRLETEAVASAPETPGAGEALRSLHGAGFTITIVSNNSTAAVRTFLVLHELAPYVRGISARTRPDPALLKPSPFLVQQAIRSLGTSPEHCVMVGDSTADIDAAHGAGVPVIAYANKPGKADTFRDRAAEHVIDSIDDLRLAATGK
jgi:phosphoglycolate phosphatase